MLLIFVTPSTSFATVSPNFSAISFLVPSVSSITSCNRADIIVSLSAFIVVKIFATSNG